ncbi:pyruvate kinase [Polluticoccus soli]|uniref:pyruvate kinase n=1 Tax=Polluticoccus soli TaxID=3034150 RepID=UPI0023E28E92|nr:pyruvate kinase [Flavipsychrobacter sp. JY13-12]
MDKLNTLSPSALVTELERFLRVMDEAVEQQVHAIENIHPDQQISARNLLQYLKLRSEDIRPLQDRLHLLGLSSLNSSESHIRAQVEAILQMLGKEIQNEELSPCNYHVARNLLYNRSIQLFGTKDVEAIPYIMITFDARFADDVKLVTKLLERGMNIARINCAHDNRETWMKMINTTRTACRKTGLACKIYMDLAGPKIRTVIRNTGKAVTKKKKRIKLYEGQKILFAEPEAFFDPAMAVIGCDETGVTQRLKPGDRVLYDDGVVEMQVVDNTLPRSALLQVVRISAKKRRLREKKGINFPDTMLDLPALTEYDRSVLPFVCANADLIGYSFVRKAADVQELQQVISAFNKRPCIIVKIETSEAVERFPSILLQAMTEEVYGVMIARGDLAVEIGFEQLSEVQEELVWVSEAGHAPLIWATQVLDSLNKRGIATRAEVTDAYYAAISECVMVNKGRNILKVIDSLRDILKRSRGHRIKKRYTCGVMDIATRYFGD